MEHRPGPLCHGNGRDTLRVAVGVRDRAPDRISVKRMPPFPVPETSAKFAKFAKFANFAKFAKFAKFANFTPYITPSAAGIPAGERSRVGDGKHAAPTGAGESHDACICRGRIRLPPTRAFHRS